MSVAPFKPLTKEEIAEILDVSIRTVENFVSEGLMPAPVSLGRRVYWHPDLFYSWFDSYLRAQSSSGQSENIARPVPHAVPVTPVTGVPKGGRRAIGLPSRSTLQQRNAATALDNVAARSKKLIKQLEQDSLE